MTGGGQGISTQHSALSTRSRGLYHSTWVPTQYQAGRLAGRRRTTPLAPLGDGHSGPDFRRAVGSRSKASRGARPTSGHLHLHPIYTTQLPRHAVRVSTQYQCPSQTARTLRRERRCSCEGLWTSPAHPDSQTGARPAYLGRWARAPQSCSTSPAYPLGPPMPGTSSPFPVTSPVRGPQRIAR